MKRMLGRLDRHRHLSARRRCHSWRRHRRPAHPRRLAEAATSIPTRPSARSPPKLQSLDEQREDLKAKQTRARAAAQRAARRPRQELQDRHRARGRDRARHSSTSSLRYAVPGASWAPSYDARLHVAERAVELSYFGLVRNSTGEDWNDVALTLSTARPNLGGGAPELRPWIVDVAQPVGGIVGEGQHPGRVAPGRTDRQGASGLQCQSAATTSSGGAVLERAEGRRHACRRGRSRRHERDVQDPRGRHAAGQQHRPEGRRSPRPSSRPISSTRPRRS